MPDPRLGATLLQKAGVRFATLGREERCTGDPARRIGNEFLFQQMAAKRAARLAWGIWVRTWARWSQLEAIELMIVVTIIAILAAIASKVRNVPYYVFAHGAGIIDTEGSLRRRFRRLKPWAFRRSAGSGAGRQRAAVNGRSTVPAL